MSIDVTAEGMMRAAPAGRAMSVAAAWKDLGAYENLLIDARGEEDSRGPDGFRFEDFIPGAGKI